MSRLTVETLRRDTGTAGVPGPGSSGWVRSTPSLADAVQVLQKAERGTLMDERGRSYTARVVIYLDAEPDDLDGDPFAAPDMEPVAEPEPMPDPMPDPMEARPPAKPTGLFD